jgi:hypothetical protein
VGNRHWAYYVAKSLEGIGMIIVLVGVVMSMQLGIGESEGMESMKAESYGLAIGGGLFVVGWIIERTIGSR